MKNKPVQKILYTALLNKDTSLDGVYLVGVKTTGIFCRLSCTARKPKPENVEFFHSAKEALLNGYRPCKICSPMENKGNVPDWLKPVLHKLDTRGNFKIKDYDLRNLGIDPHRVRRWFKKHHGMTFQSYLRSLRINQAFGRIKMGDKVTGTAFETGYESVSGFTESFKKTTGFSPAESPNKNIITITRIPTPVGTMLAGATDEGVCLLEFTDRRMLETQLKRLRQIFKADLLPGVNKHFEVLDRELKEYFNGILKHFTVPLVLTGTPFQEKVWRELLRIPYGVTRSYKKQAESIGAPNAVRAVARANGDNRIAIIIPCHRVIGENGKLTGYGGGLWRKQFLLNLEAGDTLFSK